MDDKAWQYYEDEEDALWRAYHSGGISLTQKNTMLGVLHDAMVADCLDDEDTGEY